MEVCSGVSSCAAQAYWSFTAACILAGLDPIESDPLPFPSSPTKSFFILSHVSTARVGYIDGDRALTNLVALHQG